MMQMFNKWKRYKEIEEIIQTCPKHVWLLHLAYELKVDSILIEQAIQEFCDTILSIRQNYHKDKWNSQEAIIITDNIGCEIYRRKLGDIIVSTFKIKI